MININFSLINPWSDRFDSIKCFHGSTPFDHKCWELQFMKTNTVIKVEATHTTKCDHAGTALELGLFGYDIALTFYDSRHWDYKNKCWEIE
jgi:hypothetical protein